jgi:hypothetical protein
MNINKYIKTEDGEIIIFPKTLQHYFFKGFKPTSAGFIDIDLEKGVANCYGMSTSLGLEADEKDSFIATSMFFGSEAALKTLNND